jgi:hypothetical protein
LLKGLLPDLLLFHLEDGRGLAKATTFLYPFLKDKSTWKWANDVEHFDALPVRSRAFCSLVWPVRSRNTSTYGGH